MRIITDYYYFILVKWLQTEKRYERTWTNNVIGNEEQVETEIEKRKGKQDETMVNMEKELNYYLHEHLCKGYYYLVPQCIHKHIFGRQYKRFWGCGSRWIPWPWHQAICYLHKSRKLTFSKPSLEVRIETRKQGFITGLVPFSNRCQSTEYHTPHLYQVGPLFFAICRKMRQHS